MSPASGRRLLILLTGREAEARLGRILEAFDGEDTPEGTAVLIISHLARPGGASRRETIGGVEIIRLETSEDRGYGGNRKLGLHYAINHRFGVIVCLSDAGILRGTPRDLLAPFVEGKVAAVLATGQERGGGFLASVQRRLLNIGAAGFRAGHRAYAVEALRQIPFERNSDDFHFDNEVVIQLASKGMGIVEIQGATAGPPLDLHTRVKSFRVMLRAAFHRKALFYDRKFDVEAVEETYDLKLGFPSSHTFALASVRPGATVLDLGCGRGYVAREFAKKAKRVTATDRFEPGVEPLENLDFKRWDLDAGESPVDISRYDQIFLLDIIEHLKDPEEFLERLRVAAARTRPEIILTTANIAFFVTRGMLLFGHFNYGRKGILDRTHTRLFTVNSLRELMEQTGYAIEEVRGIPAPYARVLGLNALSRTLAWLNGLLIRLSPGIFSYQIFVCARANPTISNLLSEIEGAAGAR